MLFKEVLAEVTPDKTRRTKIVATVGPASRSPEQIKKLIMAGVNVFRLNFSHGSHADHGNSLNTIRAQAKELQTYVAVLQDLGGPKVRITNVEGEFAAIQDGQDIQLKFSQNNLSTSQCIYVESVNPTKSLVAGHKVLLGDGGMVLQAQTISSEVVICKIIKGGRIRSRMGIAFPDSNIELPATTSKDFDDLRWGVQNKVDYVAISFVQNAKDILGVREEIKRHKGNVRVIAKIERKAAVENLEEILDVVDGVMVARGDLGIELPLEKLPMIQKMLIERANYKGLPVIVATQMLQSMITSLRPTRAEVSDVSTAVMNGADAVMLSEETAIGENPVECVQTLSRIALESERSFQFEEYKLRLRDADSQTIPDAIAYAACGAAVKLQAPAIIACTETGSSARLIAKYRPQQTLYGTSSSEETLRRMCLYWGVNPISCAVSDSHSDETHTAMKAVQKRQNLPNGSIAVITGGLSVRTPGATSVLEVREMNFL